MRSLALGTRVDYERQYKEFWGFLQSGWVGIKLDFTCGSHSEDCDISEKQRADIKDHYLATLAFSARAGSLRDTIWDFRIKWILEGWSLEELYIKNHFLRRSWRCWCKDTGTMMQIPGKQNSFRQQNWWCFMPHWESANCWHLHIRIFQVEYLKTFLWSGYAGNM